ncbi:hypothetical protein HJC23_009282 [Cyclotella cryptica]|uniref:Uncharacterized protein n=1 Tax=Cyclotella cryptica TaxID=29204 RepID=A0ABD3QSJ2_9STRA|eukprot:CCRYP_002255-RA/>CCRYP_002255-RA protein AED:0.01 eAED:0.01 QI:294/1/1/1/0/0/2/1431/576
MQSLGQPSIPSRKDVYANAQALSASRKGNALFQSVSSSTANQSSTMRERVPSRRPHPDLDIGASLTSSINTQSTYFRNSPFHAYAAGVSAMGNRLNHFTVPEDDYGVELDREEIRRFASDQYQEDVDATENDGYTENGFRNLDGSTVGTDPSKQSEGVSRAASHSDTKVSRYESELTKDEMARRKFEASFHSPGIQRTLFLMSVATLLGICLLFTFVNLQSKTYEDWMEPNRNSYTNEGIDWAPGPDAPPPQVGAQVDPVIERNIANWALGTLRVSSEASVDGYGSVSLSQSALARDVPLFFGLEYTGANMLDMLLGQCLNLVQASKAQLSDLTQQDSGISLILSNGRKYVNVDTTTVIGIDEAFTLGLVTSGLADVIYSPLLHQVSSLFSPQNQARLFVMLRHPVEAQFARLRYLRGTSSGDLPERYDELMNMSYEEFSNSDFVDDDWMTRALVNKVYGEVLTPNDMQTAKEILRRKAIIGLYDAPLVSFKKYARYFNWDQLRTGGFFTAETEQCVENLIEVAKSKDEILGAVDLNEDEAKEGSKAWKTIMERNKFDYELFMYGQMLYKYQIGLS